MADIRVGVLSVVHDVADARLGRVAGALRDRGADVLLEGVGDPRGAPDGVAVVARRRPGAARRVVRALVRPFAVARRVDVLVVVDPDLVPAAWLAGRVLGAAVVVDVHEDYGAVARDRPWARGAVGVAARQVVRLVLALAARADLTTVADEHVPPGRARHRLVVRNRPVVGTLPAAGEPAATPRAVYVGDLRPSRGLQHMLDAVGGTSDWHLDLVGELNEVDVGDLHAGLQRRGLVDRVALHGRLPLDEAWRVAGGAWVGLCLLEATPAYVAAMPTKVYEYLAVGLPVLATPLPRVRTLLDGAGAGVCVSRADEAASTLRHWSAHPAELAALRVNAQEWAATHLAGPSPFETMAAAICSLPEDDHLT